MNVVPDEGDFLPLFSTVQSEGHYHKKYDQMGSNTAVILSG